jgi:putative MATE family efflux protein
MSARQLTSGSIPGHVRAIAMPASFGLIFHTMYNVVDSFYAGRISTEALAAMGVGFPVFLLIVATGSGLARGASALIANAIGEGNHKEQQGYVAQALSLALLTAAVLTALGFIFGRGLFQSLGADGEYLRLALRYMQPIFAGALFFVLSSLSNAVLVASGDSKTFSKVLIAGFFLNLILDPWFLHGGFGLPAMGIAGIAWATVLIQALGASYLLSVVIRRGLLDLRSREDGEPGMISFAPLTPNLRMYGRILKQAVPATFNILSVALGFFAINYFIKSYGKPTVAAFGVTTRIEQIALMPTFGISSAIMALVGQNNGAKDFARVRESMRVGVTAGLALSITSSIIIFCAARPLMWLFTKDTEVIEIGVRYVRIMMPILWSYVMTAAHVAFLQATKRPMYGFFESPLRRVLLPAPLMWLVVYQLNHGVESVWYVVALANVAMTAATVIYARWVMSRLN